MVVATRIQSGSTGKRKRSFTATCPRAATMPSQSWAESLMAGPRESSCWVRRAPELAEFAVSYWSYPKVGALLRSTAAAFGGRRNRALTHTIKTSAVFRFRGHCLELSSAASVGATCGRKPPRWKRAESTPCVSRTHPAFPVPSPLGPSSGSSSPPPPVEERGRGDLLGVGGLPLQTPLRSLDLARGQLRDPAGVREIEDGERLRLGGREAAVVALPAVPGNRRASECEVRGGDRRR